MKEKESNRKILKALRYRSEKIKQLENEIQNKNTQLYQFKPFTSEKREIGVNTDHHNLEVKLLNNILL